MRSICKSIFTRFDSRPVHRFQLLLRSKLFKVVTPTDRQSREVAIEQGSGAPVTDDRKVVVGPRKPKFGQQSFVAAVFRARQ